MRRTEAVCVVAALVLGGCGGDSDDSDTAAGGSSDTTMATGGGPHPTDHVGNPTSTCSPAGTSVAVVVSGTRFDKDCYAAPASQAFTIAFDNKDSVAHNIAILESHTASDVLFRAEIFQGPRSQTFNVGALRPGTYAFHCEVHPNQMSGTFVVK